MENYWHVESTIGLRRFVVCDVFSGVADQSDTVAVMSRCPHYERGDNADGYCRWTYDYRGKITDECSSPAVRAIALGGR